jgi:hypothetical protein
MCTKFWFEGLRRRALERLGRRWEDKIKMGFKEVGVSGVGWIRTNLVQDRNV